MRRSLIAALLGLLIVRSAQAAEPCTVPPLRITAHPLDPNCPATALPPFVPPSMPQPPPTQPGTPVAPTLPAPAPATADAPPSFASLTSSPLGDSSVAMTAPGYLDPAAPMNVFRLRYDSEYHIDRPDRAEFFYAKTGLLGGRGVPDIESAIDAQQLMAYLEVAPTNNFSFFAEVPYRILNPEQNDNASGLSDVSFGAKAALINDPCRILTLQVKGYAPSGDAAQGLGNGHWTVEPSLLAWKRFGERTQVYAQVGDWIPLTDSDFAGNVLDYGVGISYAVVDRCCYRISPIAELIGWSVFSGKEFTGLDTPVPTTEGASGTTILNAKLGVRFETDRQSIYVGYGRALTSDVWYRDIVRVEYRLRF